MPQYTCASFFELDAFKCSPIFYNLSDKDAGILIKALFDYHYGTRDEDNSDLPYAIRGAYSLIITDIDVIGGKENEGKENTGVATV
jgi:hypothetical protein